MRGVALFLFGLACYGQAPDFPATPLPAALAVFGSFNQLGTPTRYAGGVSAVYPVVGSIGIYGTTTTDIIPKRATDPVTGREFWALSANIRQGGHKALFHSGRLTFLLGGDVGPGFSQAQPSGINVDFSGSFVATGLYQISRGFSMIVPVRMLYIEIGRAHV